MVVNGVEEDIVAKRTKLEPAPLAYPNGGGLKAMGKGITERQRLERQLMELQHQLNLKKLGERHTKENTPDKPKTRPASKSTTGTK